MKGSKIFKAAFIVMIISIISRFLGLFRDMLVSYQFGMNMYTDAYKAAVSVPETVFTIVGLAISTVFIPMLSKVKYEKNKEEMFKFSNNIISILLVISIIAFSLGFAFTREIVANGYITQLGLFHDNMFNQFNLASDLMEPFRVLIDQKVLQMKLIDFEHSEKMQLVDILNQEVLIDGKNQYVNNAIKIYCKSVFDALNDDDSSLMRFYRIEL